MKKFLLIPFLLFLAQLAFAGDNLLSLQESISIALENNPSIDIAREKIREAQTEREKARSNFLPRIYTLSSYTRLDKKKTMDINLPTIPGYPPMPTPVLSDDEIYDYNLSLSQPLFTGGKLISLYNLQKENLAANRHNFEKVKNDLIFAVKEAYFKVLEAERLRKVAQEALNQTGAHLKLLKDLFAEGMVAEVEVLRAKVALANANRQLINVENRLKFSRAYFNNLLNRDLGKEVRLKDVPGFENDTGDLSGYIKEAYKNRPEIKEMQNRLRMAEEKVRIARASFFPQVALTGSWDKKKGAEIPIDKWKESWSAVISVSIDIWDWGENKNELEKAKSQMKQIKSSFSLLKNQVELEVRQAYLNLLSAKERIKVQKEAVKEAEKNFKDTSARFKEGMATNTDVLDARTLLTRAEMDYYRALYGYQIAKAGLERAVGGSATSQKGEKR